MRPFKGPDFLRPREHPFGRHRCDVCARIFEDRPCWHSHQVSPRLCSIACVETYLRHDHSGVHYFRLLKARLECSTIRFVEGYSDKPLG